MNVAHVCYKDFFYWTIRIILSLHKPHSRRLCSGTFNSHMTHFKGPVTHTITISLPCGDQHKSNKETINFRGKLSSRRTYWKTGWSFFLIKNPETVHWRYSPFSFFVKIFNHYPLDNTLASFLASDWSWFSFKNSLIPTFPIILSVFPVGLVYDIFLTHSRWWYAVFASWFSVEAGFNVRLHVHWRF